MTFLKSKPCSEYGCSNPVFSNKLCKYHAAIKALKTPNKKVVSEKKKYRMEKYYELRDAYLKEHPVCEVEGCESTKVDLHHKAGRIGENLFKHFMSICRRHHLRCDTDPTWAYDYGYLLKRNFKYD